MFTSVKPALEAAHIYRYGGVKTNDERNGMLLRADVHRLFDRHWISFVYQGGALVARVSTRLAGSEYTKCDGKRIELPKRFGACPHPMILEAAEAGLIDRLANRRPYEKERRRRKT
jgi:putative restriction endonuclease